MHNSPISTLRLILNAGILHGISSAEGDGARESEEGGSGARRAAATRGEWRRGERAAREGNFRGGW
jgi:hypothetical protein